MQALKLEAVCQDVTGNFNSRVSINSIDNSFIFGCIATCNTVAAPGENKSKFEC